MDNRKQVLNLELELSWLNAGGFKLFAPDHVLHVFSGSNYDALHGKISLPLILMMISINQLVHTMKLR